MRAKTGKHFKDIAVVSLTKTKGTTTNKHTTHTLLLGQRKGGLWWLGKRIKNETGVV